MKQYDLYALPVRGAVAPGPSGNQFDTDGGKAKKTVCPLPYFLPAFAGGHRDVRADGKVAHGAGGLSRPGSSVRSHGLRALLCL